MTDLTIGSDTFRVETEGDAARPALILSHALGTDLTMWDGQIAALTDHFRVIRYDHRGHGGSAGSVVPTSIAQLGRDAVAILDALDIQKAHWLGLSMGGAVGLWLLANAPDRIDRAVLANTAPCFGAPEIWNARITAVLAQGMTETASATMTRWFSSDFARDHADRVESIEALVKKTSPQAYAGCCAALRDMDLRETLGRIGHDVLVVSGRDDPVVPDISVLTKGIAAARHIALEARHMSNIEAESTFNAAVISFLTSKLAPRRKSPTKSKPAAPRSRPRKAAASKTPLVKRGHASRRSNTARSPLKKVTAKRSASKATGSARQPTKKKPETAGRRPTGRAAATRPIPTKTAAGKGPAKAARKALKVTARRPTPTTTARGVVAKKAKPSKTPAKTTTKNASVKTIKKPPIRRRPTGKSRRPTGRRKP